MKLKDILESKDTLSKLNNTKGMSSVVAYRIGKNIKLLDEELQTYRDVRRKLLEEACNKDENGKLIIDEKNHSYDIPKEKIDKVSEEIEKLEDEELDIKISKISLEDIAKVDLTPKEIISIEFMLEEGD